MEETEFPTKKDENYFVVVVDFFKILLIYFYF